MHTPRVTIRSTCYNHADFVEQSLDSIARQDFCDVQWIIVDDASEDNSVERIRGWLARHQATLEGKGFDIEFVVHESNCGFVATLNEIVAKSKGVYLCGLATDDVMRPHRISAGLQALEQAGPACAASYSDAFQIDQHGLRVAESYRPRQNAMSPSGDIYEALLQDCFICAPTVMIRTQSLRDAGPYDARIVLEDYDMWLRVAATSPFVFCSDPLVEYRLHDHNFTKSITRLNEKLYWIYRKHRHHRAGQRRLLRHFAVMAARGELTRHLVDDFRGLALGRPPLVSEFFRQLIKHPGKVCRGRLNRAA